MTTNIKLDELTRLFQSLLTGYAQRQQQVDPNSKTMDRLKTVLNDLSLGYSKARDRWAESQRGSAEGFNLFEILELDSDEASHSKILAWLLDRRIERGTHAQGNLGFSLFLKEVQSELEGGHRNDVLAYADQQAYWVRLEVSGSEARVDIEIAARGKFLIHVENKIHAKEGSDQSNREWRDLQARRKELAVPEDACHGIFLTLDGSKALNPNFRPVAWGRIARVLEKFADQAQPPEVKVFARHCAKCVRRLSATKADESEVEVASV